MSNFISVKKFMETFGQEVKSKPAFPSEKISKLRYDLIKEELDEFQEALNDDTKSSITKNGLRNIAIMSIAPTGSISNIVLGYENNGKNYIGVSGGVEPIFSVSYTRRSESFNKRFKVFVHGAHLEI